MDRALLIDPDNLNMRYNFACTLARDFGERDSAIRMLESSLSRIKGSLGNADTDPDLECLRGDPRFEKILSDAKKRLGITGAPAAKSARTSAPAG